MFYALFMHIFYPANTIIYVILCLVYYVYYMSICIYVLCALHAHIYPADTIIYVILCLVYYVYYMSICLYVCFMEDRKVD